MVNNQLENNKYISEANKWLKVLEEKAYLELPEEDRAAVKKLWERMRDEVKSYQASNHSMFTSFNELTKVLDQQEGFFWLSVNE